MGGYTNTFGGGGAGIPVVMDLAAGVITLRNQPAVETFAAPTLPAAPSGDWAIDLSGCALDAASVDAWIAAALAWETANGSAAGHTLNLSGGANAEPSAAGWADAADLLHTGHWQIALVGTGPVLLVTGTQNPDATGPYFLDGTATAGTRTQPKYQLGGGTYEFWITEFAGITGKETWYLSGPDPATGPNFAGHVFGTGVPGNPVPVVAPTAFEGATLQLLVGDWAGGEEPTVHVLPAWGIA